MKLHALAFFAELCEEFLKPNKNMYSIIIIYTYAFEAQQGDDISVAEEGWPPDQHVKGGEMKIKRSR